ncbi:MAG: InlB B-repeat-containing protein [Firmicutes bacterium]|nr:InlB B-repeat-containing protein [Bacillota bacterium]
MKKNNAVKLRPVIAVILAVILLAGMIAVAVRLEEYNPAHDNGGNFVQDGSGDNSGGNINPPTSATPVLQMIESLQENIRVLTTERDAVIEELLQSELSNELKEQLIYDLENNIATMQIYIAALNEMILTLQAENAQLKATIAELEEIRDSLLQACYALEQLVETLNQGLLEYRFGVVFMFNDTIYSVQLVPVDGRIEIENPASTDYVVFLGWSLFPNGDIINLADIKATADITLYAVITRKYNVNFVYENTSHGSYIVEMGNTRTVTAPANTDRKIFIGWTLNGVTVINTAAHPIFEHTTFFARVETRHRVEFAYKRGDTITNISTQFAAVASGITVPSAPTFAGYTFGGWTLNQSTVTPRNIALNGDVIFFAKYTPANQTVASGSLPATQHSLNQNRMTISNMYIDRVFINLDSLIDQSSPLDSLSVTVQLGLPSGNRSIRVTLDSFHDISYESSYSGGALRVYCYALYHKANAPNTSGIPSGTHIIVFDTWVESNFILQSPDNISVRVTAITYRFTDNFKY